MKPIEILGASLYWCEGTKAREREDGTRHEVILTNSEPKIIAVFVKFLRTLKVEEGRLRVQLHLYPEHNIKKGKIFWSRTTGVPLEQFHKVQIKKGEGKAKKSIHGVCQLRYASKETYFKIDKLIRNIENEFIGGE